MLRDHRGLVVGAVDYTVRTLEHNLFLFVLPAYYASATLGSANVAFLAAVALGALVTAIDPCYETLVAPRPAAQHGLLAFAMFAALQVALGLVGMRPFWATEWSAALCALGMVPAWRQRAGWPGAALRATVFAGVAVVLLVPLRAAIPPAPLHLARGLIARDVRDLEPVDPAPGSISLGQLRSWGGLVAYTAIYAPAGLREPVTHVWRRGGRVVTAVALSPVRGGRAQGFRTYSRRADFGARSAGHWAVDVLTAHGQLIGRLTFVITE
jgi:uncharacterized membrane protein YvlD (DUF360 family)